MDTIYNFQVINVFSRAIAKLCDNVMSTIWVDLLFLNPAWNPYKI